MSWYTHSLRAKLLVGFGAVLAVLAGIVLYALSASASIGDRAETIGTADLPAVRAIGELKSAQGDYRSALLQYVNADDARRDELDAELAEVAKGAETNLATYEKIIGSPEDRRQWETVSADWKAYLGHTPQVTSDARKGDWQGATAGILEGDAGATFAKLASDMDAWTKGNSAIAAGNVRDAQDTTASVRTMLIVLGVLAALLAVAIALLIARSVVGGVRQVLVAAESIAEGDLSQDVDVKAKDEVGQMAAAFGRLTAYVREMAQTAERVADGDLTRKVTPRSDKDVLGLALSHMRDGLVGLVGQMQENARTLSAASQQMASTSEEAGRAVGEIASAVSDVAQGAERQVRSVEEAKAATEEVSHATEASARSAEETAVAAAEARRVAQEGEDAVGQATEAMRAVRESSGAVTGTMRTLAAKSEQIGGIVETITGISEQTNLLALNAAIEAARAGEQGRGFAVVAEEVRKLAEESQAAAATISTLVAEIQGETTAAVAVVEETDARTEEGAATVDRARNAFTRIGASVDDMTGRVDQIAAAVQQIAASAQKVQSDMTEVAAVAEESSASSEQVSASTQETSASAQEIASSAQELAGTAAELEELVGRFRLEPAAV
ncbi:MAG TPA: methyl-accepting chemotaxis protein [Solirubrobacteraceae bacterium]|nr:methyl-accepting chemotaxis protein [Solirubrobacteraceae bacterium]